jgi:hypothetical protein
MSQESTVQSQAYFEARLKEIRGRQDSGRNLFWLGAGLSLVYLSSYFIGPKQTVSLSYVFGVPLIAGAMALYGFSEAVSANQEEALLVYQRQMKVSEEAKVISSVNIE